MNTNLNPKMVENNNKEDLVQWLSFNWHKRIVTRKSGQTEGKQDTYIFAPDGTKLRSNTEIIAYMLASPNTPINPYEVNMDQSHLDEYDTPSRPTIKLVEELTKLGIFVPSTKFKLKRFGEDWSLSKASRSFSDTPPLDSEEESFLKRKFQKFGGRIPPQKELEKMALSLRQTVGKVQQWFVDESTCYVEQLQNSVVLPMSPPISPDPDIATTQTVWHVNQPNPQRPLLMQFYPNSASNPKNVLQQHMQRQQVQQHQTQQLQQQHYYQQQFPQHQIQRGQQWLPQQSPHQAPQQHGMYHQQLRMQHQQQQASQQQHFSHHHFPLQHRTHQVFGQSGQVCPQRFQQFQNYQHYASRQGELSHHHGVQSFQQMIPIPATRYLTSSDSHQNPSHHTHNLIRQHQQLVPSPHRTVTSNAQLSQLHQIQVDPQQFQQTVPSRSSPASIANQPQMLNQQPRPQPNISSLQAPFQSTASAVNQPVHQMSNQQLAPPQNLAFPMEAARSASVVSTSEQGSGQSVSAASVLPNNAPVSGRRPVAKEKKKRQGRKRPPCDPLPKDLVLPLPPDLLVTLPAGLQIQQLAVNSVEQQPSGSGKNLTSQTSNGKKFPSETSTAVSEQDVPLRGPSSTTTSTAPETGLPIPVLLPETSPSSPKVSTATKTNPGTSQRTSPLSIAGVVTGEEENICPIPSTSTRSASSTTTRPVMTTIYADNFDCKLSPESRSDSGKRIREATSVESRSELDEIDEICQMARAKRPRVETGGGVSPNLQLYYESLAFNY